MVCPNTAMMDQPRLRYQHDHPAGRQNAMHDVQKVIPGRIGKETRPEPDQGHDQGQYESVNYPHGATQIIKAKLSIFKV